MSAWAHKAKDSRGPFRLRYDGANRMMMCDAGIDATSRPLCDVRMTQLPPNSRPIARGALSFALIAGALSLAACQKAPKGQTVAIVNGDEITVSQLAAELQDVPVPDYVDRKQLSKLILQGVIDRHLQVTEARKQGLDKSDRYKALLKRNQEELLAAMLGHKVAQQVPLPVEREIQNYITENPLQFAKRQRYTMNQLSFVPPRDRAKLSILADVHSLEAADAALKSIGITATRGQSTLDSGLTDRDVATQIDRAPPGEPILLPQGDRLAVGVITARTPIAMSADASNLAAARAIRAATLLRESQAQIAAARDKAKITYEDPALEPDPTTK